MVGRQKVTAHAGLGTCLFAEGLHSVLCLAQPLHDRPVAADKLMPPHGGSVICCLQVLNLHLAVFPAPLPLLCPADEDFVLLNLPLQSC